MHGALTLMAVVPAAVLGALIVASLLMGAGGLDSFSPDTQLYGP